MRATKKNSLFLPNYIASSVLELKPEELKRLGITHLVFDIDETVVPKKYNQLTDEYIGFLQALEKKEFIILIGSNTRRDLGEITKHLSADIVPPSRTAFKPLKRYFKQVIETADVPPKQIAMVGDKLLNDVIGANRVGLTSILVEPYTRRMSWLHRWYHRFALGA